MDPNRTPVLFISHGSPMFALEPGQLGAQLHALGQQLRGEVEALVIVSAHWLTQGGVAVTGALQPETIHDFGGFPPALYELRYPASGSAALAANVVETLQQAGLHAQVDPVRGLDHGAWVPLMHFLPDASVPVLQVSLPFSGNSTDAAAAFALGRALAPLRNQGVLVIGSGSLTHNLRDMRAEPAAPIPYVVEFGDWIRERMLSDDRSAILAYREHAPHADRAHPSDDHFLPLLVSLGAASEDEAVTILDGGIRYGALSMESYVIGAAASH